MQTDTAFGSEMARMAARRGAWIGLEVGTCRYTGCSDIVHLEAGSDWVPDVHPLEDDDISSL